MVSQISTVQTTLLFKMKSGPIVSGVKCALTIPAALSASAFWTLNDSITYPISSWLCVIFDVLTQLKTMDAMASKMSASGMIVCHMLFDLGQAICAVSATTISFLSAG